MRYYATRPLRVGDGTRVAGEEVPEAGSWRNLRTYLAKGYISAVPDEVRQPPPAPRGKKVATRTDKSASTEDDKTGSTEESEQEDPSATAEAVDAEIRAEGVDPGSTLPEPSEE